jgi:signal transduction histidine kinase
MQNSIQYYSIIKEYPYPQVALDYPCNIGYNGEINKVVKKKERQTNKHSQSKQLVKEFRDLLHHILNYALQNQPRVDFLREVSRILLRFSGCDTIEIRLIEQGVMLPAYERIQKRDRFFNFKVVSNVTSKGRPFSCFQENEEFAKIYKIVMSGKHGAASRYFTGEDSFWTEDIGAHTMTKATGLLSVPGKSKYFLGHKSLAVIPFVIGTERIGFLQLSSKNKSCFTKAEIQLYDNFAQMLGLALINQRAQWALRERVKELVCLYGIARAVERTEVPSGEILCKVVMLLPPAWQYPEITTARIVFDGRTYLTSNFREGKYKQAADIVIHGEKRGWIEVIYLEPKPELDEGPFLKEERSLLNAIARELAFILERIQINEERQKLQKQLLHADRLATIGQLAAGVAHELNEPLANILGFAQLVSKTPRLTGQTQQDIKKIITASFHAREIVKKLLLFSRQMPTKKTKVDINQIVREGLYFLESRCEKEGIKVTLSLAEDLPVIDADASQLTQVLVNLVVNAIQAMPQGGVITIQTHAHDKHVSLIVEDTGIGMDETIIKKIFIPFFTTKEVGQGTGLGLSVVHGIVTSHGGTIKVHSEVGHGSRFKIRLPVSAEDMKGKN